MKNLIRNVYTGNQSPFSSVNTSAPGHSPFATNQGQLNGSPFGAPKVDFGSVTNKSESEKSVFGSMPTSSQPSPFGNSVVTQPSTKLFAGKSAKEMLTSFYQQKNPQKIGEIDNLLRKYTGNEEQLFRNLAKKYQMDPSAFGLSKNGISLASNSGFGQPSTLGGESGLSSSANTFGAGTSGGGFASFASSSSRSGFGSSAQSPFGSSNSNASNSAFGNMNASPFGTTSFSGNNNNVGFGNFGNSTSPFGGPRR